MVLLLVLTLYLRLLSPSLRFIRIVISIFCIFVAIFSEMTALLTLIALDLLQCFYPRALMSLH